MPLFAYVGCDGPRGAEPRKLDRPEHLDHSAKLGGGVDFAGPLQGEAGAPCRRLVMFEADDLAGARVLAEADPYLVRGIFDDLDLHETRRVAPRPEVA